MLTDATAATSNVVSFDAQLPDVSAAAAYVQATVGVPLSPTDLEGDVCAGRSPVRRTWGRRRLFRALWAGTSDVGSPKSHAARHTLSHRFDDMLVLRQPRAARWAVLRIARIRLALAALTTGVTAQDRSRQRVIVVSDKSLRVTSFHKETVKALAEHRRRGTAAPARSAPPSFHAPRSR